jgi:phage shock protein A
MEPTDLGDMDPQSAREYVQQFLTSLRATQHQREKLEAEREIWESRVRLANASGRAELVTPARERLADTQRQLGVLTGEENELQAQVDVMRAQLRRLAARAEMTVNAEQLLTDLNALVGERDLLAEQFEQVERQERTEQQLRDLKDGLNPESPEGPGG